MARWLRLPAALAVSALVLQATASAAIARSASPSKASFTKQVCATVSTNAESARRSERALIAATSAYRKAPSQTTAVDLRDAITQVVSDLEEQMTTLLGVIQTIGTPKGSAAIAVVTAVIDEVRSTQSIAHEIAQQAAAIDLSTPEGFAASVQQVVDEIESEQQQQIAAARANPAYANPPRAMQPLVAYMNTHATTCKR